MNDTVKRAEKLLREARRNNNTEAVDSVVDTLEPLAEAGDTDAMILLAEALDFRGWKDYNHPNFGDLHAATDWLQKAEDLGSVEASCKIGDRSFFGYGSASNYSNAEKHYLIAVEKGSVYAMYMMGECVAAHFYDEQRGIPWWTRAAEKGHAGAMYKLGCTLQDRALGVEWLQKGAAIQCDQLNTQRDIDKCFFALVQCYFDGDGVEQDPEMARQMLLDAAKTNAAAAEDLYMRYCIGNGFPQDEQVADKILLDAIQSSQPWALDILEEQLSEAEEYAEWYSDGEFDDEEEVAIKKRYYEKWKDLLNERSDRDLKDDDDET